MLLGAGFVASHHIMSHHPIRERLIGALGGTPFLIVYSLVSTVFYAPLCVLWWQNSQTTPIWWAARDPNAASFAGAVILAGFMLLVGGAVTGSKTSMAARISGQEFRRVVGVNGFTRHPVFSGFILISIGHLLVDGGAVDVAFHGTNLVVSLIGGWHQDQRGLLSDPTYADWMKRTRLFPLPWTVEETVWTRAAMVGVALGVVLASVARVIFH